LIAGGIGINPLMSMVRHVDQARHPVQTTLIYSAKTSAEFVFRDELDAISSENANITILFTATDPGEEEWSGRVGRIDGSLLEGFVTPGETTYYLCGPPGMPTELARVLVSIGVPTVSLRFEEW
jgi:ferredoxin-NADP reductase